jgi:hypothetical protein
LHTTFPYDLASAQVIEFELLQKARGLDLKTDDTFIGTLKLPPKTALEANHKISTGKCTCAGRLEEEYE